MEFNLTLIGQSVAMIVFVWFCMKYIWPVITGAIEARQTEIAEGLAAGGTRPARSHASALRSRQDRQRARAKRARGS